MDVAVLAKAMNFTINIPLTEVNGNEFLPIASSMRRIYTASGAKTETIILLNFRRRLS